MPWVDCIDCDTEFWREDDEEWKVRCFPCWRARKGKEVRQGNSALDNLRAENASLRNQIDHLRGIEDDLSHIFNYLGFLIFACHPDRCPGREKIAHEVMVWLNRKREEMG